MSQATIIKEKMQVAQQRVMDLLQWSELRYCEFQEAMGYGYLNKYLEDDEYSIKLHSESSAFWLWWRNHFYKRDESFLLNAHLLDLTERKNLYRAIHCPDKIEFTPHASILAEVARMNMKPVVNEQTERMRLLDELLEKASKLADEIDKNMERVAK
jgi:hypothetical protein